MLNKAKQKTFRSSKRLRATRSPVRSIATEPQPVYNYDSLLRPSDIEDITELFSCEVMANTTSIDSAACFFRHLNSKGYSQDSDLAKNHGTGVSSKRWNTELTAKSRSLEMAGKLGKKLIANITSCRKVEDTISRKRNRPESTFVRFDSTQSKLWPSAMILDDINRIEPFSRVPSLSLELDEGNHDYQNLDGTSIWSEDSEQIYEKPEATRLCRPPSLPQKTLKRSADCSTETSSLLFSECYEREMSAEFGTL